MTESSQPASLLCMGLSAHVLMSIERKIKMYDISKKRGVTV